MHTSPRHPITEEQVFDSLPDGIVILDTRMYIEAMNYAAENLLGASRRQSVGKHSSALLPQELEELALKALREERAIFGDAASLAFKGGTRHTVQPSANPLRSQDGRVAAVLLQLRDFRVTRFLEEKGTQHASTITLEGLMQGLAHELKNPLSGIRGAAQILSNDTDDPDTKHCADIIVKEADRLKLLIESFKALEPFSSDDFTAIDINEVLREIEFLEGRSQGSSHIEFVLNFDLTLPPVHGERNSLKQVFLNLVRNSIQTLGNAGTIEIRTRWVSDYKVDQTNAITVSVIDDGPGIPREHINDIFKPYFSTRAGGTGLGLFLAYQIVAKHGGAIMVDSEEGKGARFDVFLPVRKQGVGSGG